MNRARAAVFSLAVAVAAAAGVVALGHSIALGTQARTTSNAEIRRRTAQLGRYQTSLEASLAKRPPPLPPVPAAAATASTPQPARVVYRRAAPVVRTGNDEEHSGEPWEERDDD
jgi:hypothetical protein